MRTIGRGVLVLVGLGTLAAILGGTQAAPALDEMVQPAYTAQGDLIRPEGYRTWVFVGASLGLSYEENGGQSEGPGAFHNVYIQPQAYDHFMETGEFPEKTILAMETFLPGSRESINQAGYFEKDFVGMAVAVKDRERYDEGWAYLSYRDPAGGLKPAAGAFPKETCFNCHAEHGATDNVFTQFYPILQRGR